MEWPVNKALILAHFFTGKTRLLKKGMLRVQSLETVQLGLI